MEADVMLAIVAMVGYGVTAVIYKLAGKEIDAVTLTLITAFFMTLVALAAWLLVKEKHVSTSGASLAVAAGIIAGIAFLAFVYSIQLGKSSVSASIRGLSFLVTFVIAAVFLSEKLSLTQLAGLVLAVLALVLLSV